MNLLRKTYSFLIDIIQSLLIAAAVFLIIYQFLFRPFEVKGDSMFPNFENNDYVLTNLINLRFTTPKIGDVLVFKAPPDPEKAYIKRVIGTPGDTVMINNGSVYLNIKFSDEKKYLSGTVKTYAGAFLKDSQTITVPEGMYFVMGDNREHSSDSREWGFVKLSELYGFSFFVYWPVNEAKFIKNPYSN